MQKDMQCRATKYSSQLISKIKNNEFPKYHVPNSGKNYTGGRENLARKHFNIFLGSCSYAAYFCGDFNRENSYVG